MKILYLSISYVPSRSASSVHAMKMCAALARAGHSVELVTKFTPSRHEPGVEDDFAFYGVSDGFKVSKLPRPQYRGGGFVFLQSIRRLLSRRRDLELVYSRDLLGAWLAARAGHRVIFEAHGLPTGAMARFICRRLLARAQFERIVFISQALRDLWQVEGLVAAETPTLIAHDAADPLPAVDPQVPVPRSKLSAGYVGHLYGGRGVELMVEVARRLPEVEFNLVGGRKRELAQWKDATTPDNVHFHGFVPPSELPGLYQSFDLLLMPYQRSVAVRSGHSDTARWMSPMKMFEYLAAGKAIVSSDLPVLREVLENEVNALLVDPEDTTAWSAAIARLAGDEDLRTGLGRRGHESFTAHHTWAARARAVLRGIDG